MRLKLINIASIVLISIFILVQSLDVVFERAWPAEYSDKYLSYVNASITRYGRKSPYYLNFHMHLNVPVINNVTLHLVFYEYLHNEYRRSFVELHKEVCSGMLSDPYIGKMFVNIGLKCPMLPGPYNLANMSIDLTNFPYKMPFNKVQVEIVYTSDTYNEFMGRGYIRASIKASSKRAQKNKKKQLV